MGGAMADGLRLTGGGAPPIFVGAGVLAEERFSERLELLPNSTFLGGLGFSPKSAFLKCPSSYLPVLV